MAGETVRASIRSLRLGRSRVAPGTPYHLDFDREFHCIVGAVILPNPSRWNSMEYSPCFYEVSGSHQWKVHRWDGRRNTTPGGDLHPLPLGEESRALIIFTATEKWCRGRPSLAICGYVVLP